MLILDQKNNLHKTDSTKYILKHDDWDTTRIYNVWIWLDGTISITHIDSNGPAIVLSKSDLQELGDVL